MCSIKVKFRPSAVTGREGSIYYQIIHGRKVRQLHSAYKVFPDEWDERRSMVTSGTGGRTPLIMAVREGIRCDIERLSKICRRLDASDSDYSPDDVIDEFNRYVHQYTLSNFMESLIVSLRRKGQVRTSETYRSALNSFMTFRHNRDIMLDRLDSEIMEEYQAWHKARGVTPNTISFYNRILRAVYNRAVEDEIIENRHPFRHVYTGVGKTVKRALPLNVMKRIKALDLTRTPGLDFARDMFMMSFYLRGMSFVDMAFLRKTDLRNGYVTYRRRKTGQLLIIEWTKEMQTLLDKYPENKTIYLLPIIRNPRTSERCTYRNTAYNINHSLKRIAGMVGITIPLTLYVARHSWASAARDKGIPLPVISGGMGHDSETTTRIYLADLDTSVVDRANSLILSSL